MRVLFHGRVNKSMPDVRVRIMLLGGIRYMSLQKLGPTFTQNHQRTSICLKHSMFVFDAEYSCLEERFDLPNWQLAGGPGQQIFPRPGYKQKRRQAPGPLCLLAPPIACPRCDQAKIGSAFLHGLGSVFFSRFEDASCQLEGQAIFH